MHHPHHPIVLLSLIAAVALGFATTQPSWAGTASRAEAASAGIPARLRPVVYQTLAKDTGPAYIPNTKGCATLPKQDLKGCFGVHGIRFRDHEGTVLNLRLAAFGRHGALTPIETVRPRVRGNRIRYPHRTLAAWWRVLPLGFEQGFTLTKRPAGTGPLMLVLTANTNAHGVLINTRQGSVGALAWGNLRYGRLAVTDAHGKIISATLKNEGSRIVIAVNDAHAIYPLTVDPLVWIEQKVTANDGETGDRFGTSVAVDGATALVGAPVVTVNGHGGSGAAYVFTDANGTWKQTAKLTASNGAAGSDLGGSVALDGTTALLGAPGAAANGHSDSGAAYVFTDANGTWKQTAKLKASDGAVGDEFGLSVALDGTTALIGAPEVTVNGNSDQGAAFVFTETNGRWRQTAKLTADGGAPLDYFGTSVALDGTTALVGENNTASNNPAQGAAVVFTESNGAWRQTAKLKASNGSPGDGFGLSVALDGTTALISAENISVNGGLNGGAAYVFTKTADTWTQTAEFSEDNAFFDQFGSSVALNGTTALVGAPGAPVNGSDNGAVYVFTENNGSWTRTREFTASDGKWGDQFGYSVALDGSTALVGADYATVDGQIIEGAAYFYGASDLGLAVSAPAEVAYKADFTNQTIVTNDGNAASPAVSVKITVPAATRFVSAHATQGSCSKTSDVVTCNFGAIDGNAGTASANVTLEATGGSTTIIHNTASIAKAAPPITASAITSVVDHPSVVAQDGTITTDENTPATGTLKATDADGNALTFSIVSKPAHGSVSINNASDGSYTYTPDQDYSGTDSFTFQATDTATGQLSNTAAIGITVKAGPPAPPPSGGGGGASSLGDLVLLAALANLGLLRRRRGRTPT